MAEADLRMRRELSPVWERLRGGVIVSCQAPPGHPMRSPSVIACIAQAVTASGAVGVRIDTPEHIQAVRQAVDAIVVGLWKDGQDDVYITPTLEHAQAVALTGADIVAIDGTQRPRPDGRRLAEVIDALHAEYDVLVLADVATAAEGIAAVRCGADAVATTLAGHTDRSLAMDASAAEALAEMYARLDVPVIAEGGIVRPEQACDALRSGAWSVVIGKAITSPDWITAGFVEATAPLRAATRQAAVTGDGSAPSPRPVMGP